MTNAHRIRRFSCWEVESWSNVDENLTLLLSEMRFGWDFVAILRSLENPKKLPLFVWRESSAGCFNVKTILSLKFVYRIEDLREIESSENRKVNWRIVCRHEIMLLSLNCLLDWIQSCYFVVVGRIKTKSKIWQNLTRQSLSFCEFRLVEVDCLPFSSLRRYNLSWLH